MNRDHRKTKILALILEEIASIAQVYRFFHVCFEGNDLCPPRTKTLQDDRGVDEVNEIEDESD